MPRAIRPDEQVRGGRVNLHPSVWEALRTFAFYERTTMSEIVRRAVDEYLAKRKRKERQK